MTKDVHETAAGALWNLAFNPGNALCIVEDGGVQALIHLCSSSLSKMARFMAALALAYMFDGRMEDIASIRSSLEGTSESENLDVIRRMALKHIEDFVLGTSESENLDVLRRMALKHIEDFVRSFSDPQVFATALASTVPTSLAQITEGARIPEAAHLRCSGAEIGRFVSMLRNPSSILKACAAFALLQFTMPGGRHSMHHKNLLQNVGAPRVLQSTAASAIAPVEAKIFAKIVLRNLEHHQNQHAEASI